DYDISGTAENTALSSFKKFKLFPNASVQYSIMPQVYFALNYNKKINLPSISALNPNNTTYQNPNSIATGNPNLQPTIFDNYEAKISAFDYAFIGYSISRSQNRFTQLVTRNGDVITNQQINIPEMNIRNFNLGLPIPFMIFSKPLSEIMKFNFNPDKINFLYIYAANQKHIIPNLDTNAFWMFNIMSQIILPKDIKLTANYFYLQRNASYFYFVSEKPIGNTLDITLSKKFMKDRLSVSVFANDIFNGQKMAFRSTELPYVRLSNKFDSRNFGFSLNYKIPTRNKLAKEAPNMLNQEKKEDSGLINQGQ
ncbi:MAG: outer membrane beta-barrel family protein, partial [Cruoricaptor ignavus]|nr:outer membrane beta-barrel family protein [Cruoricaptor ignavus]